MPAGGYLERTVANVTDSDGTLVLHFGPIRGGTERTVHHCEQQEKPCLLVDLGTTSPVEAAAEAAAFLARYAIAVLNVAGPRASQAPRARELACEVIARLLGPPDPAA